MDKAANLTSVRPSDLLYKGRRVFIPANSMADHPDIVSAVHPNAKTLANMVQNHQLSFIPDDAVISAMCRDLTGELLIDANTEMNFADPVIEFSLLDDESWDEQQYKADDPTPMDAGSIIFKSKQLGFQRMICHVSEPFWFPDMDDMINNSLRVKTSLYCNRTRGVQNFNGNISRSVETQIMGVSG